jgi:tetratricopeptide (TPR) repeat protein/tRNA A-37 threonylcarbamoyl transferase component Bud32
VDDLYSRLKAAFSATHDFERELGGGGMSRTYLATERALNRRVVIKVLAPELLAGVSVERFKREVLLAAQLQHPHIVPVIASGDADGLPWFTMPYVDGESLRHRLARGPATVTEAVAILRDVARALAFAHHRGVVHRDIKPDNVLLAEGSATVTDFGIAKAISAARTEVGAGAPTLTQAGTSIGTPQYMAPEQAAADPATDHRSDLYSYGIVAYELLTGQPPFVGRTPAKLLAAQMSERPRDLREARPDLPPALADLVMACLEKEAANRPQSAGDIVRVLDTVASSGAASAAPAILKGGQFPLGKAVGLWAVATALVVFLTWAASVSVGLPGWAVPAAVGVMLLGLPAIAATAYVQRTTYRLFTTTPTLTPGGTPAPIGTMATLALKASPHVSWRRTWLGGAVAVGAFVLGLGGFMVARANGIGPAGTLIARGKLAQNEKLILADFKSPASDTALGVTITEALRADLAQSRSLRVMSRANVRDVLRLMRRPTDAAIDLNLAREVATRDGIKAIVDGEVVQLGSGYVVAARLLATQSGEELGAFRETAATLDDLLPAVERLSRALRERVGESFRSIRAAAPLERVTTSSVDALRMYVQGMRAIEERNDLAGGAPLLEEAIRLDTGFAMAYRKLGVSLGNLDPRSERVMQLLSKAYDLRDRLSESERLLTVASYHSTGPRQDLQQARLALQALTELDSTYFPAFNNLAVLAMRQGDWRSAEVALRRANALEPGISIGWTNLSRALAEQGRSAAVESLAVEAAKAVPPGSETPWRVRAWSLIGVDQVDSADAFARAALEEFGDRPDGRAWFGGMAANIAGTRGRLRERRALLLQVDSANRRQGVRPDPLLRALEAASAKAFFEGDAAAARALAQRALRDHPPDALTDAERDYGRWAWHLATAGASDLARPMIAQLEQRIARRNVDDDRALLERLRGDEALRAGRPEDAVRIVSTAIKEYPSWGVGLYGPLLADAYAKAGRPDSAIAVHERYLRAPMLSRVNGTGPRYTGWTYQRLGELYEAKGDFRRALDRYEALLTLWKNADPELQPIVRDVRGRVERLRARTLKG